MTSAKSMQTRNVRVPWRRTLLAASVLITVMAGCQTLQEPTTLDAPGKTYQLWGVAPFANESGVSDIDAAALADAFVDEAQLVRGVHTVPTNRVILAMRELGIRQITSHAEAVSILRMLDLDGLVVGTITAYDAYRPLRLGLAVQLYGRPPGGAWDGLDSRALTRSTGTLGSYQQARWHYPIAQAANLFDATNHATLMDLEAYTRGRVDPDSAFGAEIYLASISRFARFASYRLMEDLLEQQRSTVEQVAGHDP